MRELGVIDLVCDTLILRYGHIPTGVSESNDVIVKVCTLCYRVLKHISADCRANEMYCAQ